jgi:hypothetical protein
MNDRSGDSSTEITEHEATARRFADFTSLLLLKAIRPSIMPIVTPYDEIKALKKPISRNWGRFFADHIR